MQGSKLLLGIICLFILISAQFAFGLQYFDAAVEYAVGFGPYGVTSADLNGDTYKDLVTANYSLSTVSVLLGNGNGTFGTRVNYGTGSSQYPQTVRTGDMDKDGNLDIVTGGSMGFVIFYGDGSGAFDSADVHYFGESVLDIVLADFNKDSYLDIVTSHAVRDSVGIHLNDQDSTYTTHMVPTGDGTVSLAVDNLDSDTYPDILVGCNDGTVWNLQNDSAGSFTPTMAHLGVLNDPARIAVTDLNGDNIGDFVVIHATNDWLFVFFNNGDGTYTVGTSEDPGDFPRKVMFADVNDDNADDVLVIVHTTDDVKLYLNDGPGTFTYDTAYTVSGAPRGMAFDDFDGDGYNDLAITSNTTDDVGILINRLSLILSVDDVNTNGVLPNDFSLEQNYPNPFNPDTKIRFSLPTASHVKLELFNMLGQSVMVLVDEYLSAGLKEVSWNGVNANGQQVASGMYLYRITTDEFTDSKTMVLLK